MAHLKYMLMDWYSMEEHSNVAIVIFILFLFEVMSAKKAYSLIGALRYSDFVCHLADEYTGCIVYADDIILISASFVNL